MNITTQDNFVDFGTLKPGTVVRHCGDYYLKIFEIHQTNCRFNAINLRDNEATFFSYYEQVTEVDHELIIK